MFTDLYMKSKFLQSIMNQLHLPTSLKIGNLKGSTALAAILIFVTVAITIIIGLRVYSDVESTINLPAGSQANASAVSVIDQTYSSFELSAVILVVIIAGVILSVLIGFSRV